MLSRVISLTLAHGKFLHIPLLPVSSVAVWVGLLCRYLGTRPVKLFRVKMQESQSVLAVSSRSWLSYSFQSRFHLTPLSYDVLEFASGFSSEQCPEGIVAIASNTLRILSLEKLGVIFNQVATPLQYTPRKLAIHLPTGSSSTLSMFNI